MASVARAEELDSRSARHDAVVQMLRDREVEDRDARDKRQRGYKQTLNAASESSAVDSSAPSRLNRFSTKVPCRATPEARALLDDLRRRFSGWSVSFPQTVTGEQTIMVSRVGSTDRKQIGWVEHCVQTDAKLCNVRNQGLVVETDGGTMLVLRFRYPRTAVRMFSVPEGEAGTTSVEFAEIRPALDLSPPDKSSTPRQVWLTRTELEMMNAVRCRDYESFYVRLKLEVQAGIWDSLSTLLAASPTSLVHRGAYYSIVWEPDATNRRICQRTVDDSGRVVDIGTDRIYETAPATDILFLYLEGDILADFAAIYFSLHKLGSPGAHLVKEEFFTAVRRFWAASASLASCYGSDVAAVLRIAQRALPMPAQAPLLKQDWSNLRQSLIDRYGECGCNAAELAGGDVKRPNTVTLIWPFAAFPAGEVNLGLRVVYRQDWRDAGVKRGEVIRTTPAAPASNQIANVSTTETIIEQGETSWSLENVLHEVSKDSMDAMKWHRDSDGSINMGVRSLAAMSAMGLEAEYRASSQAIGLRLTDMMLGGATKIRGATAARPTAESDLGFEKSFGDSQNSGEQGGATQVHSRLQREYEVLTRPAELQNVVLVAEELPSPVEIDVSWVRQHDWILSKVLLDESFRDALNTIGQVRAVDLEAGRERLYEHLRANILHYQRAIWRQEDPHQRAMRYRKWGKKVPLDWRFELECAAALTIEELADRLAGESVDGQFAAYSTGRAADLDQLIEAPGPIGYYGNYAVYHMRPELASDDLCAMLHFFKSPYLQTDPQSGETRVADPVQIAISEGQGAVTAEWRRRIAFDTGGVMIDVIHHIDRTKSSGTDERLVVHDVPEGEQLILEGGVEVDLLGTSGDQRGAAGWAILCDDGCGMQVGDALDPDAAQLYRLEGDQHTLSLPAPMGNPALLSLGDGEPRIALSGGAGRTPAAGMAVLGVSDEPPRLSAGRSDRLVTAPVLPAWLGGEQTLIARVGSPLVRSGEQLILAAGGGQISKLSTGRDKPSETGENILTQVERDRVSGLVVGAGVATPTDTKSAQLLLVRPRQPMLGLHVGTHAHRESEHTILARGDEWLRPSLVAG